MKAGGEGKSVPFMPFLSKKIKSRNQMAPSVKLEAEVLNSSQHKRAAKYAGFP